MRRSLFLVVLLGFPSFAFAENNISVTVNGHTYQCSEGGGSFVYRCKCETGRGWNYTTWELVYVKLNRETGAETEIRALQTGSYTYGDRETALRECAAANSKESLCR